MSTVYKLDLTVPSENEPFPFRSKDGTAHEIGNPLDLPADQLAGTIKALEGSDDESAYSTMINEVVAHLTTEATLAVVRSEFSIKSMMTLMAWITAQIRKGTEDAGKAISDSGSEPSPTPTSGTPSGLTLPPPASTPGNGTQPSSVQPPQLNWSAPTP